MTTPAPETPAPATQHSFEVEVLLTVKADDETGARAAVDEILQRAWDTDRGRHHVSHDWHFEMLDDGLVTDITELEEGQ